MRELREWMREKMRRRPRRGPNESESTGKSGQELPANQLAPLRPSYPESVPATAPEPTAEAAPAVEVKAVEAPTGVPVAEAEKKIVEETQPEFLGTPPAGIDGDEVSTRLCGVDDWAAGVG